jgi:hypothetical protein
LKRLSEPLDEAPADKAGGEMMESLEDVGVPFAADSDLAVAGEPGQAPLDRTAAGGLNQRRSQVSYARLGGRTDPIMMG